MLQAEIMWGLGMSTKTRTTEEAEERMRFERTYRKVKPDVVNVKLAPEFEEIYTPAMCGV